MLGNDVVDLGDPETQPGVRHPRFDARVFTREEQALLAAVPDPERLRWSLWAAKEAAYKCVKKLAPSTFFSPVRFAVQLDTERTGSVACGGRRLRLALFAEGDALHAVATDAADPLQGPALARLRLAARPLRGLAERAVLCALAELPAAAGAEDASQAVRRLARETAAAQLGCDPEQLRVAREGRRPRLLRRGAEEPFDLSLSHHGRYVAAALEAGAGSS